MRSRPSRRAPIALAAALAVATFSGCAPTPPPITVPPQPTSTPLFATEEEALAAAEEAYRRFQLVTDQVLSDGGVGAERIETVASGDLEADEKRAYAEFEMEGLRTSGSAQVVSFTAQEVNLMAANGAVAVSAYICLDVSGVDVLDSTGASRVSAGRPALQAFEVSFNYDESEGTLVPVDRIPWDGGGVC